MNKIPDAAIFLKPKDKRAIGQVWEIKPLSRRGIREGFYQLLNYYVIPMNGCCGVSVSVGNCYGLRLPTPKLFPKCGLLNYSCISGVVYYWWTNRKPSAVDEAVGRDFRYAPAAKAVNVVTWDDAYDLVMLGLGLGVLSAPRKVKAGIEVIKETVETVGAGS